jgi:hypothetical protein
MIFYFKTLTLNTYNLRLFIKLAEREELMDCPNGCADSPGSLYHSNFVKLNFFKGVKPLLMFRQLVIINVAGDNNTCNGSRLQKYKFNVQP